MGNRPTGTGFFEAETGLEKCHRSVETLTFRLSVRNVRQNADYLSGSPPIGELREMGGGRDRDRTWTPYHVNNDKMRTLMLYK
jgi:hypothetical protein